MIIDKIKEFSENLHEETINNRRHIHMNPELSFKEYNTCKYIIKYLEYNKIICKKIINTGVYGFIKGEKKNNITNNNILLRADIDALPIAENNKTIYKSHIDGIMHACGHDVHTSSLLTTLKILNNLKKYFSGIIKFIFQPGEELFPGGAYKIIKGGLFDYEKPSNILGQHVFPLLNTGTVGFHIGKYMASSDELYVTVKGKGGHAAMPNLNIDPILIASHIITGLQQIISRNNDPKNPSVLSFGKINTNGATNIIPSVVNIEGTFRTMDEKWRFEAHNIMKKMAKGIARSMGGSCSYIIKKGYPLLINDPHFTKNMIKMSKKYLGNNNVEELDVWMGSEDFAFYTQIIKGCFYRLGTSDRFDKNTTNSVHTSNFDIDEKSLKISTGLMAFLAIQSL